MEDRKSPGVRKGIGLGLLLHALQLVFAPVVLAIAVALHPGALRRAALIAWMSVGVTQFLYILPVMHIYRKRGERETVKGIAIAAAATLLVCALSGAGAFARPSFF